ncbi:transcription elongation factor greA [Candidatus Phytoplasma oryzae]|uniref:Transcription elongation factor GreA n=1 Tax=Candidatus Phytoplasma oryzae TaxID=203274 RepID=A0A139JR46_9MOLU|nr:transcription elongation factor GreA [Candidatus Phytoplasma oryzae]KXT29320.1 transcription elongation factor greA [Candidatus Phytoplasma oryzae]RAM57875.1 transcription elongation factor GreA [Candidatus Phytoplasma oryzae]
MTKKFFELTESGLQKLKKELDDLKNIKRVENLEVLKRSREYGDLSENAEYSSARDEQFLIETRIAKIQNILKNVKIIKNLNENKNVNIGKKVSLRFLNNMEEKVLYLVGFLEADPFVNKISIDSPLGQSILGHNKGDIISVKTETGKTFKVEILKIE